MLAELNGTEQNVLEKSQFCYKEYDNYSIPTLICMQQTFSSFPFNNRTIHYARTCIWMMSFFYGEYRYMRHKF